MSDLFSENLKNARLKKKYSQKDVAEKIDVAKSTYSLYESGKREPNVFTIKNLANVLDISVDELLGVENINTENNIQKLLIEQFAKLNVIGQNEAIKRVEELSYIEKYKNIVSNQSDEQATTKENDNLIDISIFPDEAKQSILHTMQVIKFAKEQPKNEHVEEKTLLTG